MDLSQQQTAAYLPQMLAKRTDSSNIQIHAHTAFFGIAINV
jgi:hypothetical protein